MKKKSVIIIGAGVGGITAAIHLAKGGFRVLVVEKNSQAGGRCGRISRDGHQFDTGPTLFVMPLLYEAEFHALGESMHKRLNLIRVDPTYHLVFDDGSRLALSSDMKYMRKQLEEIEPGSFRGLERYLEEGDRHYNLALNKLVSRNYRKATDFINIGNFPLLFQLKPFIRHYKNMSAFFTDPRLKSAFTFQDSYMGLSPFEAPATFSMMPFTELAHGVWYPKGGMYSVVESLMSLALNAGVKFKYHTAVARIDTNSTHTGAVLLADGSRINSDVVLANADLPYVYKELLPQDGISQKLLRKQFSCSVISFLWGTDKPYKTLSPHTLFLADDYKENFECIDRDLSLPDNPSLYIHAPAHLDPSMAPHGQDTITAIGPVGHISENGEQNWEKLKDIARQHVFRRFRTIGITDFNENIKFEHAFTPLSWRRRYNLVKGSTHGLSHSLKQMAYFRPSNKHPRYKNLYFVGASTHPGTGVPTAMVSGRLVAERIMDEFH